MTGEPIQLILEHSGSDPDSVLDLVRDATGLGRAEARSLIANLPQPVGSGWSQDDAKALRRRFEEAGATVQLR